MARNQMAAETVGKAQRLFQIDRTGRVETNGAREGFRGDVDAEAVVVSTTVRQTPLQAIESPSSTSSRLRRLASIVSRTVGVPSLRGVSSVMRPTAAIIPENIFSINQMSSGRDGILPRPPCGTGCRCFRCGQSTNSKEATLSTQRAPRRRDRGESQAQ